MESENLSNKLIRVERMIKTYSNESKNPIAEIAIDFIPFTFLKNILLAKEDDPLLYDGYILNQKQLEKINVLMPEKIVPNFEKYFYVLESVGIYDWDKAQS